MPELDVEPIYELPVTTDLGFNILVDNLTYHTSSRYRHQVGRRLSAIDLTDEDQLLEHGYLKSWPEPEAAVLAAIKFWRLSNESSPEDYTKFHTDLYIHLANTDYADEPEHDLTKRRLLQAPLLTPRQFEKMLGHVGHNHPTSARIGLSVVNRLLRQG